MDKLTNNTHTHTHTPHAEPSCTIDTAGHMRRRRMHRPLYAFALNDVPDHVVVQPRKKARVHVPFVPPQFPPIVVRPIPTLVKRRRKGLAHPLEPEPCPTHGRTIRMCVGSECNHRRRCWKCHAENAPSIHFEDICTTCMKSRSLDDWSELIWNEARAADLAEKGAPFLSAIVSKQGRKASIVAVCSATSNFWRFCLETGNVCGPPFPPATLIATFIYCRAIGDPVACKRGPVALSTIEHDLWALRVWRRIYMLTHNCNIADSTTDPLVGKALKEVVDVCKSVDGRKFPIDGQKLQRYVAARAKGSFWDRMKALIAVCMGRSFLRKTALGLVPWLQPLQPPKRRTDFENDATTTPVLFSFDDKKQGSVIIFRIIGAFEKNNPLQAKTTRWIHDDVVHGLRAASTAFTLLQSLELKPGGYMLRHGPNDTQPLSAAHWLNFLEDFRQFSGMPVGTLGTQSFRRYWACTLHSAGLDFETIRMLGCWWSDAAKEYLSSMKDPRLNALRRASVALAATHEP